MSSISRDDVIATLDFLRAAERLKNVTRTAWTSDGHRESVAEHTWRLSLMAVVFKEQLGDVDFARLLAICIIHDLGEAIGGDISAVLQGPRGKAESERRDLLALLQPLPAQSRNYIVELWDEYEAAASPEAKLAKALDKLETIMQHNQGDNPPDFDYRFNLGYGTKFTADHPLIITARDILDRDTEQRAQERS